MESYTPTRLDFRSSLMKSHNSLFYLIQYFIPRSSFRAYCLGQDHRTTLVNVTTRLVIGKLEWRLVTPQATKLANRNERSVKEYIKYTIQYCWLHKLQGRLDNLVVTPLPLEQLFLLAKRKWNEWILRNGDRNRRGKKVSKDQTNVAALQPKIRGIDLRCRAYVNIEAWLKGNKKSNGNVFRAAARELPQQLQCCRRIVTTAAALPPQQLSCCRCSVASAVRCRHSRIAVVTLLPQQRIATTAAVFPPLHCCHSSCEVAVASSLQHHVAATAAASLLLRCCHSSALPTK